MAIRSVSTKRLALALTPPRWGFSGSLADSVSELLAAASRGEIESAYASLIDITERELFTQAIQLASGNQAKPAPWLGVSRITNRKNSSALASIPVATSSASEARADSRRLCFTQTRVRPVATDTKEGRYGL